MLGAETKQLYTELPLRLISKAEDGEALYDMWGYQYRGELNTEMHPILLEVSKLCLLIVPLTEDYVVLCLVCHRKPE